MNKCANSESDMIHFQSAAEYRPLWRVSWPATRLPASSCAMEKQTLDQAPATRVNYRRFCPEQLSATSGGTGKLERTVYSNSRRMQAWIGSSCFPSRHRSPKRKRLTRGIDDFPWVLLWNLRPTKPTMLARESCIDLPLHPSLEFNLPPAFPVGDLQRRIRRHLHRSVSTLGVPHDVHTSHQTCTWR